MGLGIPPLNIQIMLASNPLKYRILVRRLAARTLPATAAVAAPAYATWPAEIIRPVRESRQSETSSCITAAVREVWEREPGSRRRCNAMACD